MDQKYQILSVDDYEIKDDFIHNFSLYDNACAINNGKYWVVFPLSYLHEYPIIYFYHNNNNNNNNNNNDDDNKTIKNHVSLLFCLLTSRCVMIDDNYEFVKYIDDRAIFKNNKNELLPIDLGIIIDNKNNVEIKKRYQVRLNILRNCLIEFQDIKYLHLKNKKHIKKSPDYYNNYLNHINQDINISDYHPKTLVYLITYLSKSNKYKTTIIIGVDATYDFVTGYDSKKSGFDEYISKNHNELIERDSFIMPILYYYAKKLYYDSKIIKL